ncbi:MFS general substrate transporter [Neoconidiobolus thromboides FSU 785]|nr:MFS general substrate transporter [Neoconidiobolus thromboides FSU 785]
MTTQSPTPLPWKQISILLAVRFAEPVAFTIFFPFMYQMVKSFHLSENSGDIAYYAGFVASSFAIAQFISGVPWGMLSDKIGRRPVILLGLLGTASSLTLFGLSKSLPFAIVTRSLCGLLNGNVGVIKSMMAELTDNSNRAKGFSLLPMMFGLGSIVGPTLGGFLSEPVKSYPSLFIEDTLLKRFLSEFPYFLPCFVSSSLCLIGCIFGYFYLEETLESKIISRNTSKESLLTQEGRRETYNSISINKEDDQNIPKASWVTMLGYIGLSLQTVMIDELFPVWASTYQVDGGLGFKPPQIGTLFAYGGVALLVIQILFYTPIQQKFGSLKLYQMVYFVYTPILMLYPIAASFHSKTLWAYLLFLTTFRTACGVFAFTSANILIAETCPNKKILGKVNGIAQCLGSLMRAAGPTLAGVAYSWSLKNSSQYIIFKYPFTWILIAIISFINLIVARFISPNDLLE